MADTIICDMCGLSLLTEENRYVVKMEVICAYDVLEISQTDLEQDYSKNIMDIVDKLNDISPDDAEDSVYKAMKFDLCPGCQKLFIADPLGKRRKLVRFSNN